MKKAILYLRYACVEQAKLNERAQKDYDCAEKYCAENGIEIVRVFDEISTNPPRERYYFDKAMKVATQYVEDGEEPLTYFLVMDYTRISRNYAEFKEIQKELESVRVYIRAVHESNYNFAEELFNNLNPKQ